MLHNLGQMFACRGDHYPHAAWRLLITPPFDGAANMATDEAILTVLAEGHGPPTLRFPRWAPPCLTLGYNQQWQEIDEAACRRLGYAWTRRPTGGKAILRRTPPFFTSNHAPFFVMASSGHGLRMLGKTVTQ
jgi:hypothetical protein